MRIIWIEATGILGTMTKQLFEKEEREALKKILNAYANLVFS